MSVLAKYVRDDRGGAAAEFALIVPIMLVFLLGILDVGFYAWQINRAEKATQMGARYAVVTEMVPNGLETYSFVLDGSTVQGTAVSQTAFPGVACTSTACTCKASCSFTPGFDGTAFNNIANRMRLFKSEITNANVKIDYDWSGLGYAGDPNGPEVAPIVTVRLESMQHRPLLSFLLGTVDLPDFAYSLTAEDSSGNVSN